MCLFKLCSGIGTLSTTPGRACRSVTQRCTAGGRCSALRLQRLAVMALEKWERARGRASDADRRRRAFVFLRRKGFSAAAARAALFSEREIE